MKNNIELLKQVSLFRGIGPDKIESILSCLNAKEKLYKKNEVILSAGEYVSFIGIVLSGRIQIVEEDVMGNRNIMAELGEGNLFAETFACVKSQALPMTVSSVIDSTILFIDFKRVITTCASSCIFHTKLIENMLYILANKNILLSQKIQHISKRTTREKLLSYFSEQAIKSGKREFDIPFNRQALADYICVDRSAMSNELCKLRDEGILTFDKNHISLV